MVWSRWAQQPRWLSKLRLHTHSDPARRISSSQVAAFQCLQPFVGTLLAFLVLAEQPTAWDLGAIGIVAGLLLVSTSSDRRDIDTHAVMTRIRRLLSHRNLMLTKSVHMLQLWPAEQRH